VRLPSILGIQPGIYLSVLYGLVLLAFLFLLCLYPGLSRPGSMASFQTEPWGAAIRVDSVYRGAAPEELFLERGPHVVEFSLPGFESRRLELDVPGRAAFSLFFPRRLRVTEVLAAEDPLAVIAAAAGDYAAWSFTGEPTGAYQIPLSLSEGVYRGAPFLERENLPEAGELIRTAARFAVSQASLRDLSRAKFLLDNGGMPPSPLSMAQSAGDILSWLSTAPGAESWLAGFLPPEAAAVIQDSPWAAGGGAAGDAAPAGGTGDRAGGPTAGRDFSLEPFSGGPSLVEAGGIRFRGLSRRGSSGAPSLYYAESLVDLETWETFMEEQPAWAPEHIAALREQGLAAADYLIQPGESAAAEGGPAARTGVSWHGALAFCRWLSSRLPAGFEDWEVRLPSETEWEAAEGFFAGGEGAGDLWEWCADPYAPLRSFPASEGAAAAVSSPERVLRKNALPRASLPPDFCSPFAGFRPFLAPGTGPHG
jgi:hypothetical protein